MVTDEVEKDRGKWMHAWRRHPLLRVLASTALGVALIVLIAVVLAWGTIVGARTSHRAALHSIYGSVWFQALLGLFALNLACCTLKGASLRLSRLGFLVTHVALLVVCAAAVLTINFGAQGLVQVVEGKSADFYYDPAFLCCADPATGHAADISTVFELRAGIAQEEYAGEVSARSDALDGVSVLVDRYYPDATPFGESTVTLTIPDKEIEQILSATPDPEERIPIEGTDWSVTIEERFYAWKDGHETGGPEQAVNPAVRIVVHRPDDDVKLTLFSRFPGFSMEPGSATAGFSAKYDFLPEAPQMRSWREGDAVVRVVLSDKDGNRAASWIPFFGRREVALGERKLIVEYPKRVPLGFTLALDKFVATSYPRSNIPSAFESHLTVRRSGSDKRPVVVAMNSPGKAHGFLLYQSSYGMDEESGAPYTLLSLSRDPGTPVLYTGFAMLIVGLMLSFYLKPYLRRRRRSTGEAAP
jgi:hypothetical protein